MSGHQVVAVLEIVSPGNKSDRRALDEFVAKATDLLHAGIHLLIVDLFPPGPRDPEGIHKAIWDAIIDNDFALPDEKPLTLVSYAAGDYPEAFVEPLSFADRLPDMPLFLSPGIYVPVPLESSYHTAWESVPMYWRDFLSEPDTSK